MTKWTKEIVGTTVSELLRGRKLIVVSNREPYIHHQEAGQICCVTPASGLTSAIDPLLRASGGTWVAHGNGDADHLVTDHQNRLAVPPDAPEYTLRRVWLPKDIQNEYYNGLANEGLWPLCHMAFQRPRFLLKHWESYRRANELFADAVIAEAAGKPAVVFIQDYHLALLPRLLKQRNPQLVVAQFWHIPWPGRETFRIFPWKQELLDGMLGNDLLGFHVRYHCANFIETVESSVESLVHAEQGSISRLGHVTAVRPFPISIDFEAQAKLAASPAVEAAAALWQKELGPRRSCSASGSTGSTTRKASPIGCRPSTTCSNNTRNTWAA